MTREKTGGGEWGGELNFLVKKLKSKMAKKQTKQNLFQDF